MPRICTSDHSDVLPAEFNQLPESQVDGAPYSFLRLETERGSMWVAVPMAEVPKKARVVVKNGATLKNFDSKQAGRKFETVVFGVMEKG